MTSEKKITYNKKILLLTLFTISVFFIGFFLNEDPSGSGEYDFYNYLLNSQKLVSEDIFGSIFAQSLSGYTPLHFIIYSPFYNFLGEEYLRLINFLFSFSIILVFFNILKKRFENVDVNYLALISLLPLLDPYFRSSAYWFQNEITALIFFIISLYFFNDLNLLFEKKIKISNLKILKKLFLIFLFSALAFYTKQNYIFFTIFLYFYLLIRLNKKLFFFYLTLINILFYLPFLLYVIFFKSLVPGAAVDNLFAFSFQNTIFFFSFMFFYLLPFMIVNFKLNENSLSENYKIMILSFLTILIIAYFFDYQYKIGGGVFYKISNIVLGNNFVLFLSSFFGLFFYAKMIGKNFVNNALVFFPLYIIILFLRIPFQEYFAIVFFYIFFVIIEKDLINNTFYNFKKKYIFLYIYFSLFLLGSILYNHLNFKNYI